MWAGSRPGLSKNTWALLEDPSGVGRNLCRDRHKGTGCRTTPAARLKGCGRRHLPLARLLVDGVLERLAGLEGGRLARGDLDLLAGAGLDALAGGAVAHFERAEARHLHAVALGEGALDGVEHAVDGCAGVLLAEAGLCCYLVDQFGFGHQEPPRRRISRWSR